jgi:acetyl esterase/lipase
MYGRGTGAYRDALRHLVFRAKRPVLELRYGSTPDQIGDLRIPDGPGPHPVAVLIHGGFWRRPWQRDLMDGIAVDLADRGVATWNIEYRCGPEGWKETLEDVGAAVDHIARLTGEHAIDPNRAAVVGHSAGGHLALWAAGRSGLPAPWPAPTVAPGLGVAMAGVVDLEAAASDHVGDDAVQEFFGGVPDLSTTSPRHMLPLGTAQLVVHGTADAHIPVAHSRAYAERAQAAGDAIEYRELAGADHSVVIHETSPEWDAIATSLVSQLATR